MSWILKILNFPFFHYCLGVVAGFFFGASFIFRQWVKEMNRERAWLEKFSDDPEGKMRILESRLRAKRGEEPVN